MQSSSPEEHTVEAGDSPGAVVPSAMAPGPFDLDVVAAEHAELEALLRERGEALRALRSDLGEARRLLRDALARFELLPRQLPAASQAPIERAHAERDRAVARALEAEAARAEVMFRLDEVMGHLAASPSSTSPGMESDEHARLTGQCRGLQAALAEAEEARDVAQARLMLAEADLEDAAVATRALQRQLGETREELELGLIKARASGSTRARSELEGERDGIRARAMEAEQALTALRKETQGASEAAARSQGQLESLRAELAATKLARSSLEARVADLEQGRDDATAQARALSAELTALQAQLAERGEVLARMEAQLVPLQDVRGELERERQSHEERLSSEREARRRVQSADHARLRELTDALTETRQALARLSSDVLGLLGSANEEVSERDAEGEPTAPGIPLHLEAVEALEEQVAAREGRIRQLRGQLSEAAEAHANAGEEHADTMARLRAERAHLSESLDEIRHKHGALETGLRSLRASTEAGSDLATSLDALLALLAE